MKLVPEFMDAARCAEVRERLVDWRRWSLLDRGSYEWIDSPEEPELLASVQELARETTGRKELAIEASRAVRMLPGDYVFVRHDRVYDDRPVEVVVDLSRGTVTGAEVHYRHRGQVFFVVPSLPGAAAVVERGPTVMRNSTYVSKRLPEAEVIRLFVLLR